MRCRQLRLLIRDRGIRQFVGIKRADSRNSQPRQNRLFVMFATTSPGERCHLVGEHGDVTLCGLRVAALIINQATETSVLHLTEIEPANEELCESCMRIDAE